jgi:WD40 repeat protein
MVAGNVTGWRTLISGSSEVAGSSEGATKLWSVETRHALPVLKDSGLMAGFLGDGRKLVAGTTNRWCVWSPESGTRVDLPIPSSPPIVDWGKPYDVKPDELVGALGRTNGSVEFWDLGSGAKVSEWSAHMDGISVVTFSPNGKRLATVPHGAVKLWELPSRRELLRRAGGLPPSVFGGLPDGNTLAASVRAVRFGFGMQKRRRNPQLGVTRRWWPSSVFSDSTLLATTSFGGEVRLWELPSGKRCPTERPYSWRYCRGVLHGRQNPGHEQL